MMLLLFYSKNKATGEDDSGNNHDDISDKRNHVEGKNDFY